MNLTSEVMLIKKKKKPKTFNLMSDESLICAGLAAFTDPGVHTYQIIYFKKSIIGSFPSAVNKVCFMHGVCVCARVARCTFTTLACIY